MERKSAGRIIKEYREKAGMTQQELAKAIGVESRAMIWGIEKDQCKIPPKRIIALSRVFQVSLSKLTNELADAAPKRYGFLREYGRHYAEEQRQYRPGPLPIAADPDGAAALALKRLMAVETGRRVDGSYVIGHERPWYILSDAVVKALRWLGRLIAGSSPGPELAFGL